MYRYLFFHRNAPIPVRARVGPPESTSAATFCPNQLPPYILHLEPCTVSSRVRVMSHNIPRTPTPTYNQRYTSVPTVGARKGKSMQILNSNTRTPVACVLLHLRQPEKKSVSHERYTQLRKGQRGAFVAFPLISRLLPLHQLRAPAERGVTADNRRPVCGDRGCV